MKSFLVGLAGIFFVLSCSSQSRLQDTAPSVRKFDAIFEKGKAERFHQPLELKIGWYPYQKGETTSTAREVWTASFSDSSAKGWMPLILVRYPDSSRAQWFDLSVDDALLGKLLKHSLMTEMPIQRPYKDFLQQADCMKCHPANIKLKK